MTDTPQVSIVLPTYNGSRYLEQALRSCLDQTFQDLEVVVVDDCSQDATPSIIARFAAVDPRVRYFRNETNLRLPASLNRGFAESRGRYLTWTSDDNMYHAEAIGRMVRVLNEQPDVGLVYAPVDYIDEHGQVLGRADWTGGPPDTLPYRSCVGACFLYRREVYETIGGYAEDLFLVEDWEYWIRAAERFRLSALPDELYFYRLHEGSLSSQRSLDFKRVTRQMLEKYLPRMHWVIGKSIAHGYLFVSRITWESGDRMGAARNMVRAFVHAPIHTLRLLLRFYRHRKQQAESDLAKGPILGS